MSNIIRIRDLQTVTNPEDAWIPIDKDTYGFSATKISMSDLTASIGLMTAVTFNTSTGDLTIETSNDDYTTSLDGRYARSLTGLTDVNITSVQVSDMLVYSGGIWVNSASTAAAGTDGTSGSSGTDGTSGSSGTDGTSGSSGTDGTSGSSGTDGTSGSSGSSGSSGTDGTSGSSGIDGTSGSSGTSGIDGTSGSSGTSGIDGTSGSSGTSGIASAVGANYQIQYYDDSQVNNQGSTANLNWDKTNSILEITGKEKVTSLSATENRFVFSDTTGLLYTGITVSGYIPNFFVDTWEEIKSIVQDINDNYPGGNIYVSGAITMTENIIWDLTNISFYGLGATWRTTGLNYQDVDGYTITIENGSPIFENIAFGGSLGAKQNVFSGYTTRKVFILTDNTDSKVINFNSCLFSDIVGGKDAESVIEVSGITQYKGVTLNFTNCGISSHNFDNPPNEVPFLYNPFKIRMIPDGSHGTQSLIGSLRVNVIDQRKISINDIGNTSISYLLSGGTEASTYFNTNSSSWLQYVEPNTPVTTFLSQPVSASTISNDDLIVFSDTNDYQNIKNITYGNFNTKDLIQFRPTDTVPSSPTSGTMYYHSGATYEDLRIYKDGKWYSIDITAV